MQRQKAKIVTFFSLLLLITLVVDYWFWDQSAVSINQGVFLGLWGNNIVAIFLSVLALILLFLLNMRLKFSLFSLGLITIGAIINIIDRFFYGGAIDYLKFWFIPSFNLADVHITLGLIIVFYNLTKKTADNNINS